MIFFHKTTQRKLAYFFITLFCFMQIAVPLYQAKAAVPVIEIGPNMTANVKHEAEDYIMNYFLKPLLRLLLILLIQALTQQIVAWITGDEGRNVGFIKNLEQEFINQTNARAGQVVNRIIGLNLCSPSLKQFLKIRLNLPGGNYNMLQPQLACTLTGIVDNLDSFYEDFDNGGWPALVGSAIIPQNNPYGASMIAQINLNAARGSIADTLQQKINASGGFQGVQITKQSQVCERLPDSADVDGNEIPAHEECYTQNIVTTPGKLISEALDESLNRVGFDFLVNEDADFVNTVIDTIATAIIQVIMKKAAENLF